MTRDTTDANADNERSTDSTADRRACQMTGREDGLVGKYDIWLCRQSFRELAPKIGFEKYD